MFAEFGINLSWATRMTIVAADLAIRYWPLALVACLFYPCACFGLMSLTQQNKKLFKLTKLGLKLVPLILILASVISLVLPWIAICSEMSARQ